MGIMIFDYFFFTEIGLTMEVGPSKTRLQFDWCQDPSTDASIHWLLSDAPPNGELSNTGMGDCESQDEELPPTLRLY